MMRHHNGRWIGATVPRLLHNGAQRWPVQMVKVRMSNQHQVDGRKIAQPHSRLPQPLQHKQPASEIRIDDDVLAADLHEKAGMADESYSQLSIADQFRFVSLAGPRSHRRMPHQSAKRTRAFAENGIRKRWL